jgi:uncharacterized protein YqhQ
MPILENGEETLLGGQAVMEGVMMRAPSSYCVAVRKKDGEMVTEEGYLAKVSDKYPIFKLPILRGLATLGQAMSLGYKTLQFSANVALEDDAPEGEKPQQIPEWMMYGQVGIALVAMFAIFKFVPLGLTRLLENWYPVIHNRVLFNLVDGGIRLTILIGYMFALSRFHYIHRVFQYHGAEHRVVFNHESGKPVTVAAAQSFPTWHPRCGTSFLMVVMLISIPIYTLLPFDSFAAKLISRLLLFLPIAGLSYEVIRYAARKQGSLLNLMTAPGLWLQRITTQPPTDDMAEVAIHAMKGAMVLESRGMEVPGGAVPAKA